MQVIHLIRHGETENNRRGHVQGWTESPLSELGREQARRVGDRLRARKIDAVLSSPLGRAVETARIALGEDVHVELRAGLREMNLGAWEGKSAAELRKNHPGDVAMWFDRPSALRIEGAETIRAFRGRVRRTMDGICNEFAGQSLAVFAHGGVICAWLTAILGMKLDDIWRFKIRNGSFTRVIFPAGTPRIELLGEVSHLDGVERVVPPDAPRLFP